MTNKKPQPQLKSHRKKKEERPRDSLLACCKKLTTRACFSFFYPNRNSRLDGNNLREEPKTIPRNSQQKKLIQTNHLTPRRRLRLPQGEEEDATLNLL
jgi:hypothetical protein